MTTRKPRRRGGRTELDIIFDELVWALYGRESFDPTKKGEQVENQLSDLRPFVLGIGGRIGREYPENNLSAFKRRRITLPDGTDGYRVIRPDWDAMMTALRQGKYNALALPNIDRGMRDPRDLEDLIDIVEQYGVYVTSLTGTIDLSTDDGISNARQEVAQRNKESRNLSRRAGIGNRKAALKGRVSGGPTRAFGWRKDRKTHNKREVRHIQREIPRLLAGVTPRSIAIEWQERGIPTVAGGKWRAPTIAQIFTNPRLCGWRAYLGEVLLDENGDPVKGVWEPIITPETHRALVAKLGTHRTGKEYRDGVEGPPPRSQRGKTTKHLLSPFLRCGKCNAKLVGSRRKRANGDSVAYYICPPRGHGGCSGVGIHGESVDRYITALVQADQKRLHLEQEKEMPPWEKLSDLKSVSRKIQETTEAYKSNQISGGRYFSLLEQFEQEERKLLLEQRKYNSRATDKQFAGLDLKAEWEKDEFTLEQKQAAISRSIVAVIVNPAESPGTRFHPDRLAVIPRDDSSDT